MFKSKKIVNFKVLQIDVMLPRCSQLNLGECTIANNNELITAIETWCGIFFLHPDLPPPPPVVTYTVIEKKLGN